MYITAFQCTSMFQTKIVSTVSLFTHTQSFPSHPPLARISCLAPARRSACFATQTELFQLSKLWGSNWICSSMFSVSSLPSCFFTLNFLKRGFCRLLYRIYPQRTEICNREMRFHCHVFVVLSLLLFFFFLVKTIMVLNIWQWHKKNQSSHWYLHNLHEEGWNASRTHHAKFRKMTLLIWGKEEMTEAWAMGEIVPIMPCWACSTGCIPSAVYDLIHTFSPNWIFCPTISIQTYSQQNKHRQMQVSPVFWDVTGRLPQKTSLNASTALSWQLRHPLAGT